MKYSPRGVPLTRCNQTWTEARFWQFVRSNLRAFSRKWRPLQLAKEHARRKYVGPNKRQKWEYHCADCDVWFKGTEVEVDHVVACGPLASFDDVARWLERFLVESDGFVVRCKPCHQAKTNADRDLVPTVAGSCVGCLENAAAAGDTLCADCRASSE